MVNELLVTLVNSVIGEGKRTSRGNISYKCPKCNHSKNKLEINFDESSPYYQNFQCWVCGYKSKKISSLFKFLKVPKDKFIQLQKITKDQIQLDQKEDEERIVTELPKEFIPLKSPTKQPMYLKAIKYLNKRGFNFNDIIKYNLGYCEEGKYRNRLIIPSYNSEGQLNFFTSRALDSSVFPNYLNPPFNRDIIPFELFINWNSPIILCEGPFDAMSIKRNAIPLLGKTLQPSLLKKLAESKVNKIYIALDDDAIDKALEYCEYLINQGKKVYLIELNGKDPNEIGFENFIKLVHKASPLNYYKMMEKKLSLV